MKKYCKFRKNIYKEIDGIPSNILEQLIILYPDVVSVPESIYDMNGNICRKKLKKYLCVKFRVFVDINHCFDNEQKHRGLYITKKQLNRALRKEPTKISMYIGVFAYFLIKSILLAENGKEKFIKMNNELFLNPDQRSGKYVMQKTYEALLRIIPGAENDALVNNENENIANYIIDCFGNIDNVYNNISGWVNNPIQVVQFNAP